MPNAIETPTQAEKIALITQMRAGTHYICYALRLALEATIYLPDRERQFILMDDDYIVRGLHDKDLVLPAAKPDRKIYFCHYYHPQQHLVKDAPRICLVGFPHDSFYSDGVVYSKESYDVGPSGPRAGNYVMRLESPEWKFLEEKMQENAEWLTAISEDDQSLIIRYEDFFLDFDACASRLARFVGGFVSPLPRPIKNPERMYWTDDYLSALDRPALKSLWQRFEPGIRRFYPEKVEALLVAL